MAVKEIQEVTPALVEAVANLIPQLSSSAGALSDEQLADFLSQPDVFLFAFVSDEDADAEGASDAGDTDSPERILGMLTLATFTIPTGKRAWIEDVVVDEAARGQGAGRALIEAAVAKAEEVGAVSVDLTSRPSREAANRLYVRAGFEPRVTNVYRYKL